MNVVVQTLDEIKAQNAREEAAAAAAESTVNLDEQVLDVEDEQEDLDVDAQNNAPAENPESEDEDWLKSSEPEEKDGVPLAKHIELRNKLKGVKGALSEKDQEIARLNALLNGSATQPKAVADLEIPQESWEYSGEKPYNEYLTELNARNALKLLQSQQQVNERSAVAQRNEIFISEQVDQHYDRAAQLISKNPSLTEEKFKAAETKVTETLNALTGGMGEVVVNNMVARLGPGSEKVIVHLGLNNEALKTLEKKFKEDETGFSAAMYMAELKMKFENSPAAKPKAVTAPDRALSGKSAEQSFEQRAYQKAHAQNDGQKALDIKQAAKAKGIDTSSW